jgi:hypothetical protein
MDDSELSMFRENIQRARKSSISKDILDEVEDLLD